MKKIRILFLLVICIALISTLSFRYFSQQNPPQTSLPLWYPPKWTDSKMTPLMRAVLNNNVEEVRSLIKQGADVNAHTGDDWVEGESALMFAARRGYVDIVELLIDAGATVDGRAWADFPRHGIPLLRYALEGGSLKIVELLLLRGANADATTLSPMGTRDATINNVSILYYAIAQHMPLDFVKALINSGANLEDAHPNVPGLFPPTWTALMVAAYYGYPEVVPVLLAAGANISAKNVKDGNRQAIDYAREQKHVKIVKLLEGAVHTAR